MKSVNRIRCTVCAGVLLAAAAGRNAAADVQVDQGVVYAQATVQAHAMPTTVPLVLDVYRPADPADVNGKALLLVHGGSFTGGTRTSPDMVDAGQFFANRGWVCFSIEYRLVPDDPPAPSWIEALGNPVLIAAHAAMVDTKRAIRWVRAHAASYGCDTNRIAGLGHSAGAYCIVQACITDESDFANDDGVGPPDQLPDQRGKLNAGIEVSGGLGSGGGECDAGDAPLMIWHGDADGTVFITEAEAIAAAYDAVRIPCRFFAIAGKDHGAPTWTALYDGRGLKEHALDFLNLFFDLKVSVAMTPSGAVLQWPSVSNALYRVQSSWTLAQPFTNAMPGVVTSTADSCSVLVPGRVSRRFMRLRIHSGQP